MPGCDDIADLGRLVADDAVERRDDSGEGESRSALSSAVIEFGALAARLVALRLQHVEIGLGAFERRGGRSGARLGGGQRGGRAVAIGGRLLEPLLRAEIRLRELLRAVVFERGALDVGLGAAQLRLRRLDLRLGLGDDRALRFDLPAEAGDCRVLRGDLGLGRVDRELVVAVVDLAPAGRPGARPGCRRPATCGQMAGRLGGDDRRVGADIGVVGRDEETALDEIIVGRSPP